MSQNIINGFLSRQNYQYICRRLTEYYDNELVERYIRSQLKNAMGNFADVIMQDLKNSDFLPGTTVGSQINCFNNQFLQSQIGFINVHVLKDDLSANIYAVTDGHITTRHSEKFYQQPAQNILDSWRVNSGRPSQLREDPGNIYGDNRIPINGLPINGILINGKCNEFMRTGITFCDQNHIGTSNHLATYEETLYKEVLNRTDRPHEKTIIGDATPASDNRLLSRQIFRKNEQNVENGVPNYERRLYNRNLDRDISEGIAGIERGAIIRGYDMQPLYNTLDHRSQLSGRKFLRNCAAPIF